MILYCGGHGNEYSCDLYISSCTVSLVFFITGKRCVLGSLIADVSACD